MFREGLPYPYSVGISVLKAGFDNLVPRTPY